MNHVKIKIIKEFTGRFLILQSPVYNLVYGIKLPRKLKKKLKSLVLKDVNNFRYYFVIDKYSFDTISIIHNNYIYEIAFYV